jgi:hypothetical protein
VAASPENPMLYRRKEHFMWRFIFCAGALVLPLTAALDAQTQAGGNPKGKGATDGSRIYVLYGKDHKARAEGLAAVCGDRYCKPITKPIKAPTVITTLTVWGHGDQTEFCNMSATEFTKFILAWKKLNPKLKTIEILTCDARHNPMNNGFGPFSNRVAANLSKAQPDLTIKGLPIGQRKGDSSILWANSSDFCYITAPNEKVLDKAGKALLAMNKRKGDLSVAANELAKVTNRQYTLNYGSLRLVRSHLAVVRK